MRKKLLLTILLLLCLTTIYAAPFKNVEKVLTQPDGTILYCYASGDEFYSRLHDSKGYTIVPGFHFNLLIKHLVNLFLLKYITNIYTCILKIVWSFYICIWWSGNFLNCIYLYYRHISHIITFCYYTCNFYPFALDNV